MSHSIEHVSVGTELLLGDTIDSNVVYGSRALVARGLRVSRRSTVGDSIGEIQDAVSGALDRCGWVLVCGGLGPTNDDLTRDAVASMLDMPLQFDDAVWAELVERWRRIGREISDSNRSQAMVPRGGVVLPNRWGSAPGLWLESSRGVVILLPGVPLEFRGLLDEQVIPRLQERLQLQAIRSRVLRTTGIAESRLGEILGPLEPSLAPVTLAYLPDQSGVDLRLTAWELASAEADVALDRAEQVVRGAVGRFVFATGGTDLAEMVIAALRERKLSLATAESCTGGLMGARITAIAGSSDVYHGGVVSYSNAVKEAQLGVRVDTLRAHGAVSEQTAREMVQGAATRFGANVAVAVTGIAGPGGGSDDKPVGTVWFAWYLNGVVEAERIGFAGDRGQVRDRAAQAGLLGLLRRVQAPG